MTVPIIRSGEKILTERRHRTAAGLEVVVREKRRRTDDLRTLLIYACEHAGVLPIFNSEGPGAQPRGYEVGFAMSLRDAGRAIALEPELVQEDSKRKYFSQEQREYIEGLVLDLPQALAEAIETLRKGLEDDAKS